MIRRPLVTTATLAALTLGLTSCGGDDAPDPIPEAETSSSSATTSSSEPTETESSPPWADDYTPRQVDGYEAALQRWESFEQRSESIWARGKATPAAEDLFQEFFASPGWTIYNERLKTYAANDVTIEGLPTVLWSMPSNITDDGLSVDIKQCVDYTTRTAYQAGEAIERESWGSKPMTRTLKIAKPKGHNWLIYQVTEPTDESHKSCEG